MIDKENGFDLNLRWSFPDFRKHAFAFISLFVLILIIYGNSFNGAWQFDDFRSIVNNPQIHLKTLSWPEIKNAFFATPQDIILGRSVAMFSFALNYYAGGLNVFGYHLVNILIHIVASFFLYLLVYHTLNLPLLKEKYQQSSYAIALLAAVLWASSPLHVNAVTYIVQRMASLSGMAYIMSMFFYLKARTSQDTSRMIVFFLLCCVAGGMAIGSKANAVMLPIVMILYDLFLIQGVTSDNLKKNKWMIALIGFIVIGGVLYIGFFSSILDYQLWTFTITERLLTAPRVFLFYISLLLYPLGTRLTLEHDIQISRSLLEPWSTLPAFLIIIFAIGYALWSARRKPLFSFCILFFFVNHLIEGTIIPLDLIFEHRNYVPAMFFFVPVAILMIAVLNYFAYKKSLQLLMFLVMTFLLTSQGYTVSVRNDIFQYPEILWKDNVWKAPYLSRPHLNLGYYYAQQGDYQKALKETETALHLSNYPGVKELVSIHINLGAAYFTFNNDETALFHYNEALRVHAQTASPFVYNTMALIMLNRGDLKAAHEYAKRAIAFAPDNAMSYSNFAIILLKEGKLEGAIKEAAQAIALQPDFISPLATLGEAYRIKGDYAKSEYYWKELLQKDPNHMTNLCALLELYDLQGKHKEMVMTVGQLLYLNHNGNISNIISPDKNKYFPYIPDSQKLLPIFQKVFLQLSNDSAKLMNYK
jgi:tetratricopeptide (TPR) repeat protein